MKLIQRSQGVACVEVAREIEGGSQRCGDEKAAYFPYIVNPQIATSSPNAGSPRSPAVGQNTCFDRGQQCVFSEAQRVDSEDPRCRPVASNMAGSDHARTGTNSQTEVIDSACPDVHATEQPVRVTDVQGSAQFRRRHTKTDKIASCEGLNNILYEIGHAARIFLVTS